MSFLLPLATTILLGYMFDLRAYNFIRGTVYDYDEIKSLTTLTEINKLSAEYSLIESEVEYRKFLGLDVATNLKALVDQYHYVHKSALQYHIKALTANEVHMALKLSLRTVNETVPFDAPQLSGWELKDSRFIGTHYVKSIIYGSDIFLLLSIQTRNSDHKAAIKTSILSTLGRSGTLDESFREKFQAILEDQGTGYYHSSFGTVPYYADNVPPRIVNDMLALKISLAEIMKMVNEGKGAALFYEMESVSHLSPTFPLIEISSEIFKKLDDVEKKYEDLRIAYDELDMWLEKLPADLSEEDESKISDFYEELHEARSVMEYTISIMDVSTLGSIDQFSKAISSYGNATDDRKYRRKVELLRQQYPSE